MLSVSKQIAEEINSGRRRFIIKESRTSRWNAGAVHKLMNWYPLTSGAEGLGAVLIVGCSRITLGEIGQYHARDFGCLDAGDFERRWQLDHRNMWYPESMVWLIEVEVKQ